jgi:hypothetical protein
MFTVSLDAATFAGQTIEFAMFSLMPPTFMNRPNGMRIDIAEVCHFIQVLLPFIDDSVIDSRNCKAFILPVPRWQQ